MLKCAGVLLCWVIFAGGRANADGSAGAGERVIRRSDVVFMYDDPKLYETYGCTVLGWAGSANRDRIARAHAAGVRHFSCSVGFLTEFKRVIDFDENFLDAACRNFAGEPFIVPWLWDHDHNGRPAYWWCTNSPLYRRYLEMRLGETMKVEPDGLHVDDYRGTSGSITWLSGGFCEHCMAVVRENPARAKSPFVVHLLNRNYNAETDEVAPRENITLRLRHDVLGGFRPTRATHHTPGETSLSQKVEIGETHTAVHAPVLKLWGLIELGTE